MAEGETPGKERKPTTLVPSPPAPPTSPSRSSSAEPPSSAEASVAGASAGREGGAGSPAGGLGSPAGWPGPGSWDHLGSVVVPGQVERSAPGREDPPTLLPDGDAEQAATPSWDEPERQPGAAGPGDTGGPVAVRTSRRIGGLVARATSEVMITAGFVVVLFLVYQLWITDIFASRTQDQIRDDLATEWSDQARRKPAREDANTSPPLPPVEIGDGLAVLRVPRFGPDYAPVVVEGVTTEALRRGPGHFPGTAMPGEVGNFVLSGHRTTYGKPFSRVDELKVGDPILVEDADRYFIYRVTGSEIVDPHRLDVTYPVPGRLGETPTRSRMTLTTCHPRFSAKSRLIVYAELDETRDKSDGPPPALTAEGA